MDKVIEGCNFSEKQYGIFINSYVTYDSCGFANYSFENMDIFLVKFKNCVMVNADFSGAILQGVKFDNCQLNHANFANTDFRVYTEFRKCDLSGATGLVSASQWMQNNFARVKDGYIVYKRIGYTNSMDGKPYPEPNYWDISEGAFIEEVVDRDTGNACWCGINFGTMALRYSYHSSDLWKCLIHWEDLPDVVVPVGSQFTARCGRLQLLKKLEDG